MGHAPVGHGTAPNGPVQRPGPCVLVHGVTAGPHPGPREPHQPPSGFFLMSYSPLLEVCGGGGSGWIGPRVFNRFVCAVFSFDSTGHGLLEVADVSPRLQKPDSPITSNVRSFPKRANALVFFVTHMVLPTGRGALQTDPPGGTGLWPTRVEFLGLLRGKGWR